MDRTRAVQFTVRCRQCSATVLAGVSGLADPEAALLRTHLEACPRKSARAVGTDFGAVLRHFDVAAATDGA